MDKPVIQERYVHPTSAEMDSYHKACDDALRRADPVAALAHILWCIGNARIGHRDWDAVATHYLAEARDAIERLRAAGFEVRRIDAGEAST